MRKFVALLKKEIRELLTAQFLVSLVLMVVVFSFLGDVINKETQKVEETVKVVMFDLDDSEISKKLVETLEQADFSVEVRHSYSAEELRNLPEDVAFSVVIPSGFAEELGNPQAEPLEVYTYLRSFSVYTAQRATKIKAVIAQLNEAMKAAYLAERGIPEVPQLIKYDEFVFIGGKVAKVSPSAVFGFVQAQTTFIPIIIFLIIIFASQMVATAIASEKENKTLETILAAPVKRSQIVLAKMLAAGLISLAAAAFYLYGVRQYMVGFTGGPTGQGGEEFEQAVIALGLKFSLYDYVLLGGVIFFSILIALAIALILGAFAENVKSVQVIITPLMVLILVPYMLSMVTDLMQLSPALKYGLLLIPFTYSFLTAPNLFLENYEIVYFGLAYQLVVFVVLLFIAARIFASDRILTMKIKLRKR